MIATNAIAKLRSFGSIKPAPEVSDSGAGVAGAGVAGAGVAGAGVAGAGVAGAGVAGAGVAGAGVAGAGVAGAGVAGAGVAGTGVLQLVRDMPTALEVPAFGYAAKIAVSTSNMSAALLHILYMLHPPEPSFVKTATFPKMPSSTTFPPKLAN